MGDTVKQVIVQCGKPFKVVQEKQNVYVWVYSLMSFASNQIGYSILFDNHRVKAMVTTEKRRKTRIRCPHGTIYIGSKPSQVLAACGKPTTIHNYSKQVTKAKGKTTKLIYQPRSYLPKTVFQFRDGRLVGLVDS